MSKICKSEVTFLSHTLLDGMGEVFEWEGKIYRAIPENSLSKVKKIFDSGLMNELIERNLFPDTTFTKYSLEGYNLVLQHEKIPLILYPYEWSFEMMKDAALQLLETNKIANKYGFELKDGHSYNSTFIEGKPIFFDFGSFEFLKNRNKWIAHEEFLKYFLYPLNIWKKGDQHLAKALINNTLSSGIPHGTYHRTRFSISRILPKKTQDKLWHLVYKYKSIASVSDQELIDKTPMNLGKYLIPIRKIKMLPFQTANLNKLRRKISKMKMVKSSTMWVDYHNSFINDSGEIDPSPRFKRIIEIFNELKIQTVFELAGNQGAFSQLLLNTTETQHVICTDYDVQALDTLYKRIKDTDLKITPVVLDLKNPISSTWTSLLKDRIKTPECVVGLALLHHLILTQGMNIQTIFDVFKSFTTKYVFIEFMPLGLWSSSSPDVNIPDWYNLEWFKETFEKNFDILFQEQLEDNRILFVGSKK